MRWLFTISLLLLGGCADLGYYWHNASGHIGLMNQRVDIDEMLADETVDAKLRRRLTRVLEIRRFSVDRLALPDNDSYRSYVELAQPWVVQNLFAAPEFSTRLHSWCYPIIGCASYRGYFDSVRLSRYAETLRDEGFEVHVAEVSAYSTLGWFDDPVLSSFIDWPEHRLAGLLFHELTHQRIYIDDDTRFNESLASAVQQTGTELWLRAQGRFADLESHRHWLDYREQVIALIESTRIELEQIYKSGGSAAEMRRQKQRVFAEAREAHGAIAQAQLIEGGFTRWFAQEPNNARIGSIVAYHADVEAFRQMLAWYQLDFNAFFAYVDKLGKLDQPQRDRCLQAWRDGGMPNAEVCPVRG